MRMATAVMSVAIGLVAWNAAFGYGLRGSVVGNGGASAAVPANGAHRLYGTLGTLTGAPSQAAGVGGCSGFWCLGGPRVLAVDPAGGISAPVAFAFGDATPTPTRDWARFDLALPQAARVTLAVYDVAGRQVGDVVSRAFEAGEHRVFWRAGRANAGVYFARLHIDGALRATRALVVVK